MDEEPTFAYHCRECARPVEPTRSADGYALMLMPVTAPDRFMTAATSDETGCCVCLSGFPAVTGGTHER